MPTKQSKPRRKILRTVEDFYKFCDLQDVVYTDLHVWRDEDGEDERGKATLEANHSMSDDELTLVVSLRALLASEEWRYQVAVVAVYEGAARFRVEEPVMAEILNSSTIVTALPFLRAAVMDLSSKVRDFPTPVLPLAGPATGRYLIRNQER